MKTADHIKEIKNAIRRINMDGHITEVDQYMAMIELKECVNALKEAFENLEGAVLALNKTIKWHEKVKDTLVPPINDEISAGEELEESEDNDVG
jgi:hypothetical protein